MQLKDWIKLKKTSQAEVGRRLAMDKAKISRIVNGSELPTLFQAAAIYDLTNGRVKLNDWIEGLKK